MVQGYLGIKGAQEAQSSNPAPKAQLSADTGIHIYEGQDFDQNLLDRMANMAAQVNQGES
jgi:hypothetical protein